MCNAGDLTNLCIECKYITHKSKWLIKLNYSNIIFLAVTIEAAMIVT